MPKSNATGPTNSEMLKQTCEGRVLLQMEEAKRKAIDNLARYKFSNFGYWASRWVGLNQLLELKQPNPFAEFVQVAREVKARPVVGLE